MKKLIYEKPDYQLFADIRNIDEGSTAITLSTVWPQARTDRSEHTILNITLPRLHAIELGVLLSRVAVGDDGQ